MYQHRATQACRQWRTVLLLGSAKLELMLRIHSAESAARLASTFRLGLDRVNQDQPYPRAALMRYVR